MEVMNSSDWGLPQKRSRPYLRGTNRMLLDVSPLPAIPPSLLRGGFDLGRILHPSLPHTNKALAGKGNKRMANLAKFKLKFKDAMRDESFFGTFAVVDLSRDLDQEYGTASRADNRAPCLTSSNNKLWVFSLGSVPDDTPDEALPLHDIPVDRWLHPAERCLLSGFSPNMAIAVRDAVRLTGNAMSVPCVGRQLVPIFAGLSARFL